MGVVQAGAQSTVRFWQEEPPQLQPAATNRTPMRTAEIPSNLMVFIMFPLVDYRLLANCF